MWAYPIVYLCLYSRGLSLSESGRRKARIEFAMPAVKTHLKRHRQYKSNHRILFEKFQTRLTCFMLLSLRVQILSSAAYKNIFLSTGIILLLSPNSYLCTYDLYGPMRNAFMPVGK
jgi:hypothetical protein